MAAELTIERRNRSKWVEAARANAKPDEPDSLGLFCLNCGDYSFDGTICLICGWPRW